MNVDYTILPCGEPGIDQSEYSGIVFYVGKTCNVPYGDAACQTCEKFKK